MIEPVPKPRPEVVSPVDGVPSLYVYRDVLDEIRFNGAWRDDRPAGGLLVGSPFADPASGATYVEVEGYIAGTHVADVIEFTRYLRMQWKAATAALRYHFPESQLLGWYIGRADPESEPSQAEVVLHNTFFNHPWQTGLWVPGDAPALAVRVSGDALETDPVGVIRPPR